MAGMTRERRVLKLTEIALNAHQWNMPLARVILPDKKGWKHQGIITEPFNGALTPDPEKSCYELQGWTPKVHANTALREIVTSRNGLVTRTSKLVRPFVSMQHIYYLGHFDSKPANMLVARQPGPRHVELLPGVSGLRASSLAYYEVFAHMPKLSTHVTAQFHHGLEKEEYTTLLYNVDVMTFKLNVARAAARQKLKLAVEKAMMKLGDEAEEVASKALAEKVQANMLPPRLVAAQRRRFGDESGSTLSYIVQFVEEIRQEKGNISKDIQR
ncbi:hypothetical protein BESB_024210 [Besnoitia besnoiti]|uniref:Uncharacterized protein n=1 Tax=Besnoitia besnoiti TaxID=94643 RepID=A0A2A9M1T6_BESBE|nr:hypothetical protein BESB_024210 [Besnoitia besnoiti]PFH31929.1 hypothetical protein BESB_024210 [Besnoitia besnoiti]